MTPDSNSMGKNYGKDSVKRWVNSAAPGDCLVYYKGFLCRDRGKQRSIGEIGREAQRAADAGMVCLVQKRVSKMVWEYIAVRCGAPRGSAINTAAPHNIGSARTP